MVLHVWPWTSLYFIYGDKEIARETDEKSSFFSQNITRWLRVSSMAACGAIVYFWSIIFPSPFSCIWNAVAIIAIYQQWYNTFYITNKSKLTKFKFNPKYPESIQVTENSLI